VSIKNFERYIKEELQRYKSLGDANELIQSVKGLSGEVNTLEVRKSGLLDEVEGLANKVSKSNQSMDMLFVKAKEKAEAYAKASKDQADKWFAEVWAEGEDVKEELAKTRKASSKAKQTLKELDAEVAEKTKSLDKVNKDLARVRAAVA